MSKAEAERPDIVKIGLLEIVETFKCLTKQVGEKYVGSSAGNTDDLHPW
jgi:hypothetical protein